MNKKKRYIALTFILSLLCVNKVSAETCEFKLIQDFAKVENRYKVSYRYNIEKESYTLILNYSTNPDFEYKIYDVSNLECEQINSTTKECHGFKSGEYSYEIYGKNNECRQTVKVLDIEIKELQNYSDDPLCEGIEEFALCQKDYYKEMDYETFVSRVNSYKKTKQEKIEEEEIKKQEEKKQKIVNDISIFIEENIIQIIIVIIFIILVTISSIVGYKLIRKSRRLE